MTIFRKFVVITDCDAIFIDFVMFVQINGKGLAHRLVEGFSPYFGLGECMCHLYSSSFCYKLITYYFSFWSRQLPWMRSWPWFSLIFFVQAASVDAKLAIVFTDYFFFLLLSMSSAFHPLRGNTRG